MPYSLAKFTNSIDEDGVLIASPPSGSTLVLDMRADDGDGWSVFHHDGDLPQPSLLMCERASDALSPQSLGTILSIIGVAAIRNSVAWLALMEVAIEHMDTNGALRGRPLRRSLDGKYHMDIPGFMHVAEVSV